MTSVITKFEELAEFLIGAETALGDPALATCLVFVPWTEHELQVGLPRLRVRQAGDPEMLELGLGPVTLPITISPAGPELIDEELHAFGVTRVSDGLWALEPSLNIPGTIHAYVVLTGVPSPAPWERLVILASEMPPWHPGLYGGVL